MSPRTVSSSLFRTSAPLKFSRLIISEPSELPLAVVNIKPSLSGVILLNSTGTVFSLAFHCSLVANIRHRRSPKESEILFEPTYARNAPSGASSIRPSYTPSHTVKILSILSTASLSGLKTVSFSKISPAGFIISAVANTSAEKPLSGTVNFSIRAFAVSAI